MMFLVLHLGRIKMGLHTHLELKLQTPAGAILDSKTLGWIADGRDREASREAQARSEAQRLTLKGLQGTVLARE